MKMHIFKHFILGTAAIAGFGAVVMFLWNALIPDIFGITSINFWQSLGLLALARLLFGGFGGKMAVAGRRGGFGKNPIREKWEKMTPEERKEFALKHQHHRYGRYGRGFGDEFFNAAQPEKE